MTPLAEAAVRYAMNLAWPVFPVAPGRKAPPLIEAWPESATDDREVIAGWWLRWPGANIGLHCRGLLVLDVDPRHDGRASLATLVAQHRRLTPTVVQRTPRGGRHFLYRSLARVGNSAGHLAPGIDVRTTGGYIVLPPSTRPDGPYLWLPGYGPDEIDLADAPAWLARLLTPPDRTPRPALTPLTEATDRLIAFALDRDLEAVRTAPPGQRNHTLYCKARALARFDLPRADLVDDLLAAALTAGLSQPEALATISSAFRSRSSS